MFCTCYLTVHYYLDNKRTQKFKTIQCKFWGTVKLGFKEWLHTEQLCNSEPFPVTNKPVNLINSEQIGISEQFFDDQKVPYYQVWLYYRSILNINLSYSVFIFWVNYM